MTLYIPVGNNEAKPFRAQSPRYKKDMIRKNQWDKYLAISDAGNEAVLMRLR